MGMRVSQAMFQGLIDEMILSVIICCKDYPCVMFLSKMIKKENAETSASETFGMYHGLLK